MPKEVKVWEDPQHFVVCDFWAICVYNFIELKWVAITCEDSGSFFRADAGQVFSAMGLTLEALSQIFIRGINEKLPMDERNRQPTVKSYEKLGGCAYDDRYAWQALADLTGKRFNLILRDYSKDLDSTEYHPGSSVSEEASSSA